MTSDWNQVQRAHYDGYVDAYDREGEQRARGYVRKARILRDALAGVQGPVLEVGAGSGLVSALLAPTLTAEKYTALDLSPAMLEAARSRARDARMAFVVGDAMDTKLPSDAFEAVIGVDVLHHLGRPADAMAEWLRIVKPGGRLVLLEANAFNPANRAYIGVEFELRLFLNTEDNLRTWATSAGWRDARVEPTPSYTPSGPHALAPVLDLVDRVAVKLPGTRRLTALWLLTARKP
jgi:ubiquinone/menaquinone biosynthesis C-methylase UbiE